MGMIDAIIKNAHDDALSCNSFTPDWNDVDVIANCAACLTIIELNTKKHPGLTAAQSKQVGIFPCHK